MDYIEGRLHTLYSLETLEYLVKVLNASKVDKEEGKQLSDEDFTTTLKDFLDSIMEKGV